MTLSAANEASAEADAFASDPAVYKTLLESTLAIPWRIDWATMTFAYIGPQIEPLLGWQRDSWKTIDDWVARMHPEDRETVVEFCVSQSMAGVDHEADYRALTKDNGYVWIRDVVHVVRKENGEVDSLIGFMFDISERKKTEQELVDMHKRLETLSFEDALTGVSNRRMFDLHLDTEWKAACRAGQPLSLVLLDLDHFKQFNDNYGHVAGDECLVEVAEALKQAGGRPRDVVARFGGEEFVLLLPETDWEEAKALAERCRSAIAGLKVPHAGSECSDCVTVSIGAGTIVPTDTDHPRDFIRAVDDMLYLAKQDGRNRVMATRL
ncbi:PAS domain S-box-containing protein/diguanylate cyclase (GGDEF)-like protein [Novosphingobium sp. PhB165]|uniref:sensor domain-containing diguanylate cyclase n=1 Tax=Novosphingobium sp. PhB165 TaxID=2485105 RepID=UPI001052EC8F|nr:sensor domain-containing diguanylate cyclase [Novosphingobium sp. PhB165]TCM18790.1 PAS domain S-box-containing protein/diguanylate cyclase (GGDEF)-like protein [Novosphingobium sp. PhB165]